MKLFKIIPALTSLMISVLISTAVNAQTKAGQTLNGQQQAIVRISALTGKGELEKLKPALNAGLDQGLTIKEIREIIVHIYAYAGFPRSIRGLQTFMTVLDERKAKGIHDVPGREASAIKDGRSKYDRGKAILDTLLGAPQGSTQSGYAAFAPVIEVFLKEHLFSDIFERDVINYMQRELATISVLAGIGGVEPMLQSHLKICLNMGLSDGQLQHFTEVIKKELGKNEATEVQQVLSEVLKSKN